MNPNGDNTNVDSRKKAEEGDDGDGEDAEDALDDLMRYKQRLNTDEDARSYAPVRSITISVLPLLVFL